jgi:HAD superfamily hydrolase (TIGR01459 family)
VTQDSSSTLPAPEITAEELLDRFEVLLLDAYGVLVDHDGALPGAADFIERIHREEHPYLVVSNDASRTAETSARRFTGMGVAIPPNRIINSGSLIARHFEERGLQGSRCAVLGPEDSRLLVERAGGVPVPPGQEFDVLVVCDEDGYQLMRDPDEALSVLFHRFDAGRPVHLLLPNPDIVYPRAGDRFGFTAGAIATMFELALAARYPRREDTRFFRLGKPNRPLFDEALRRAGTRSVVMVGDQLATDIRGAMACDIPAVLVGTGLTSLDDPALREAPPTYVMRGLR